MTERDPDPYVMYIVVRRSLNLSPGKVAAQVGHAVHYLCREFVPDHHRTLQGEEYERFSAAREWDRSPHHTKIVLGASDDEFTQVQLENEHFFMVTDFGYTEVEPMTQTCLALWPMRKSVRSPLLKKLRPL